MSSPSATTTTPTSCALSIRHGTSTREAGFASSTPHDHPVHVTINAQHDQQVGNYDYGQWITLRAHQVISIDAIDLETPNPTWAYPARAYDGHIGGTGRESGKWRLYVQARNAGEDAEDLDEWRDLIVMNLMDTPNRYLTNLSTVPDMTSIVAGDVERDPLRRIRHRTALHRRRAPAQSRKACAERRCAGSASSPANCPTSTPSSPPDSASTARKSTRPSTTS